MSKYILVSLLALVATTYFGYRTFWPVVAPSDSIQPTAEFGGVSLRLDFATTTASREKGLSDKTSLPVDYGMLFVFSKDDRYGIWMKDTLVPLDVFWLDDKGRVVYLATDVKPSTYPHVFYPPIPARYVLETSAGFARAHAIATGTPLTLQKFPTVLE